MRRYFAVLMIFFLVFIFTASGCPKKTDTKSIKKVKQSERKQEVEKKHALKQPDPLDAITRDLCDNNKADFTILSDAFIEFYSRLRYTRSMANFTQIPNEDEFVKKSMVQFNMSKRKKQPLFTECVTTVVKIDCDAAYAEIASAEDGPRSLLGEQALKRVSEVGEKMNISKCVRITGTITVKGQPITRNFYTGMVKGTTQIFFLIHKYD
jgi:hypothetical protein